MEPSPCPVDTTRRSDTLASAAIALGIAGLLPVLPFIGSIAALVCGHISLKNARDPSDQSKARAGVVLGWVGIAAPVVFLTVYSVLLGYPFPIRRYNPGS